MFSVTDTLLTVDSGDTGSNSMRFTRVDGAILAAFALFTIGCFLGRWKGMYPFVFLGSDAGIVSSFVAAYEHPDLFKMDPLLGDFTNFRYYLALHPILIFALNKLTGDYGMAYICLLLLTVFLQCSGFYLLGIVLFRNRYWAFLLSVMALCPISLPIREFWGIFDDPLPRSLFHACLPYVSCGRDLLENQKTCVALAYGRCRAFVLHASGKCAALGFSDMAGNLGFSPGNMDLVQENRLHVRVGAYLRGLGITLGVELSVGS